MVLGSASPARLKVLRDAGLDPEVVVSYVDEDAILAELAGAEPAEVVVRLAAAKAAEVCATIVGRDDSSTTDTVVLTCDSMLLLEGELSGKPHTADVARAQWRRMRGGTGELLTGHHVTRITGGALAGQASRTASTTIHFSEIDDATIDAYVATGEPLSVAGAFTLDSLGGWFVDRIDGDPSSVVGIGLPTVRELLAAVGVDVTALWRHAGPTT
ncbi:septum formation protein [Gordonia amarae]|mgnify:CR=1 FL=1|uniref:Nucleoside triphosphate pyrophosphatase n=1 Tax=Gordonia amarae NBRC 15530 TaxID=1075090 RepID=G7GR86_9ACTN|nr:nucleoside triphosphate pyrophosphatase [Gordonia amarae]MCS3878347.1 septum formation protein [Gordonia amarae]GAB06111.1 Maf-like protein [Gordonia amarae NBRC 15530]